MSIFLSTRRMALFGAAMALFATALIPPGAYPFSTRMAQHLLLQLVIPPLLLLGLPRRNLRFGGVLRKPLLTWLAGLGAMWAWHDPAWCNAAVRSPTLHALEIASSLLMGAVFWWPIVAPDTSQRLSPPMGIIYLFAACLGCTILGIIITFARPDLYIGSVLPGSFNDWQFAAPDDQRVGGLLMWVPGCLIYICGILGLMARWYAQPETETFPAHPQERMS